MERCDPQDNKHGGNEQLKYRTVTPQASQVIGFGSKRCETYSSINQSERYRIDIAHHISPWSNMK